MACVHRKNRSILVPFFRQEPRDGWRRRKPTVAFASPPLFVHFSFSRLFAKAVSYSGS